MRSDQSAVQLIFSNRSIRFNSTYVEIPVIDWKCIQDCEKTNQLFSINLKSMFNENMSYKHFNKSILRSAKQSAMTSKKINKVWFSHSKCTLTPELASRNAILRSIRADQHAPSQESILNLKTIQQEVDEIIEIAKAR